MLRVREVTEREGGERKKERERERERYIYAIGNRLGSATIGAFLGKLCTFRKL